MVCLSGRGNRKGEKERKKKRGSNLYTEKVRFGSKIFEGSLLI
jgi:hypothetical protein